MTLRSITARFECDGCGREVPPVLMDPAAELMPEATLFDAAEDFLKSELLCSIQEDLHLCQACTRVADNIHEDPEMQPTRDEILAAIGELM